MSVSLPNKYPNYYLLAGRKDHYVYALTYGRTMSGIWFEFSSSPRMTGRWTIVDFLVTLSGETASSNSKARTRVKRRALVLYTVRRTE